MMSNTPSKCPDEPQPRQHGIDMVDRAVGEDQLAAGKVADGRAQRRIGLQRGTIDIVDKSQELGRQMPCSRISPCKVVPYRW